MDCARTRLRCGSACPRPSDAGSCSGCVPIWEAHRHRMALAVAEQFGAMRDSGEVRAIAARIVSAQAEGDHVRLILGERRTNRLIEPQRGLGHQLHRPGAVEQRRGESRDRLAASERLAASRRIGVRHRDRRRRQRHRRRRA